MNKNEILSIVFERSKAFNENLNYVLDYSTNPQTSVGFQLPQAAQTLSKPKMVMEDKWETPNEWNAEIWEEICSLDYKDRIAFATSFMSIEFKRLQYLEASNIDFVTMKEIENLETPDRAKNLFVDYRPIEEEMEEAVKIRDRKV